MRVAKEAVGADGQMVPQQWLVHTTAPNVDPADRRSLDLVIYGATPLGGALCCDGTLVSPLIRTGQRADNSGKEGPSNKADYATQTATLFHQILGLKHWQTT